MEAMRAGVEMFLAAATEPERSGLCCLTPRGAGLGSLARDRDEHGLGLIEATLQAAVDAGAIRPSR